MTWLMYLFLGIPTVIAIYLWSWADKMDKRDAEWTEVHSRMLYLEALADVHKGVDRKK